MKLKRETPLEQIRWNTFWKIWNVNFLWIFDCEFMLKYEVTSIPLVLWQSWTLFRFGLRKFIIVFFVLFCFFFVFFLNQNSQLSFCNRESSLFHSMIADRENVFCEKLCCAPKSSKLSWSLVLYLDNVAGIRFERYDILLFINML